MAEAARVPRRPQFICMAFNGAGRPVPMFDPFFGDIAADEQALAPMGEIEDLLFGARPGGLPGHQKGKGAA